MQFPVKPGAFRLSRFPCGRTPSPGPVLRPPYSRPKPGLAAGLCFGAHLTACPDGCLETGAPREGSVFSRWPDCTSQRRFSRVCFDISTFGGRRSSPRLKAGVSAAKKLMKKIKVVHIINWLNYGGAEVMLCSLLAHTDRERFESMVVALVDVLPLAERVEALGIPVRAIGMRPGVPDPRRGRPAGPAPTSRAAWGDPDLDVPLEPHRRHRG